MRLYKRLRREWTYWRWRRIGRRFQKACDEATIALQGFMAAWNQVPGEGVKDG